ncbi:MAG: hypothetical protein SNJ84_07250, partial [Verrucomicrobiia bacterium]
MVGRVYWQWSRLVPVARLDAWEERLRGLPGTTFSSVVLAGGKSARVQLYAATKGRVRRVAEQFGGVVERRRLQGDVAAGSATFRLAVGRRLVVV